MFEFKEFLDLTGIGINYLKTWLEVANHYGFPVPFILIVYLIAFRGCWNEREKYYLELLKHLGAWENALHDRSDYYEQPGSEYDDDKITTIDGYKTLKKRSFEAESSIRAALPVAKAFLTDKCIKALEELEGEHWYIAEHGSSCEWEYLEQITPLVKKAYDLVLQETKIDLRKLRLSILSTALLKKNSS